MQAPAAYLHVRQSTLRQVLTNTAGLRRGPEKTWVYGALRATTFTPRRLGWVCSSRTNAATQGAGRRHWVDLVTLAGFQILSHSVARSG